MVPQPFIIRGIQENERAGKRPEITGQVPLFFQSLGLYGKVKCDNTEKRKNIFQDDAKNNILKPSQIPAFGPSIPVQGVRQETP